MVVKSGRYGKFLACPGYPECKNTKPLIHDTGAKCPKCGGRIVMRKMCIRDSLSPYALEDYGDVQVAYLGISTPETLTKSNPTHFQDDGGSYRYSFWEGGGGQELYQAVQQAVDSARDDGADYVVALAHLGMEGVTPARCV